MFVTDSNFSDVALFDLYICYNVSKLPSCMELHHDVDAYVFMWYSSIQIKSLLPRILMFVLKKC